MTPQQSITHNPHVAAYLCGFPGICFFSIIQMHVAILYENLGACREIEQTQAQYKCHVMLRCGAPI